ncbi:phospholipase D family protein [Ekhidna sp.]|uniref:phospholipase D family protein n=1 Tax=Ekhidna sp. TaxID=2608089 RepID=UPI003C7E01C9
MNYEFKIQDPSNPSTTYLIEELVQNIRKEGLINWRSIYSWTTGRTLTKLFEEDPDINHYITQGGLVNMVIGIDTITSDFALQKLSQLTDNYENIDAKIFHNDISDLFHPKISHFQFNDGTNVLIVGSGNLTLTGLQTNIEAYSIAIGNDEEIASISAWNEFLDFHNDRIKEIDDDAIERAKKNRIRIRKIKKVDEDQQVDIVEGDAEAEAEYDEEQIDETEDINTTSISNLDLREADSVLVAQVPKAGARWHQVHYNKHVIENFFNAEANSHQRIFLKEVKQDGTTGSDEVRPVVYSNTNKNYKIEISSHQGIDYPDSPPIILLRKVATRNFLYMLLMPGDQGYDEMFQFTLDNESVGKGMRRVITTTDDVSETWGDCPLI